MDSYVCISEVDIVYVFIQPSFNFMVKRTITRFHIQPSSDCFCCHIKTTVSCFSWYVYVMDCAHSIVFNSGHIGLFPLRKHLIENWIEFIVEVENFLQNHQTVSKFKNISKKSLYAASLKFFSNIIHPIGNAKIGCNVSRKYPERFWHSCVPICRNYTL